MRGLSTLRESQNAFEADETRLLQSMTVQESIRQWLALQHAFEPQLQQTAALFAPERQAVLTQLQLRLRRLAEWQGQLCLAPAGPTQGVEATVDGIRATHSGNPAGFAVRRHRKNPSAELFIFGQEKIAETVRLCKVNLAIYGLAATSARATHTM